MDIGIAISRVCEIVAYLLSIKLVGYGALYKIASGFTVIILVFGIHFSATKGGELEFSSPFPTENCMLEPSEELCDFTLPDVASVEFASFCSTLTQNENFT